ncbi:MOSC domain-containing protein [Cucumibacter marinus]|uniref:MOSC domain-containing protein n=1 Tax=Cucumibacter marinus TaxID=1121252 RepID=UPI0004111A3B|nr:MOSC domain-containing protein [Cucumibacter marinus]
MSEIGVQKLKARVVGLFVADGGDFVTRPAESLDLGFEGIAGDVHGGPIRLSGGREPRYPRGTEIRNERQLSMLCPTELADVADALGLDELRPEWIGGNLLIEGIPRFTQLPPRTQLFFEGGAVIRVDGDNAPCKVAGGKIAEAVGRPELTLDFVKAARGRRGLVGWVEKPGMIALGEAISVRVWPQRLYVADGQEALL